MAKFTAKKGVEFADLGVAFKLDEKLSADRSADPATGTDRMFSADVDAKKAAELKKLPKDVLDEYGITEVDKSDKADD